MEATSTTEYGTAGELSYGPVEYVCARRLRHKMVLSYLSQQGLHPTFQSMVHQTDSHMCGDHLRQLVAGGRWVEALDYLSRFNSRKIVASNALHFFLHTFWALANVAAGARNGSVKPSMHQHGVALSMVISRCARLCSIVKGMVDSPQQCVSQLDCKLTRNKASLIAYNLAREAPDLNRLMQLPGHGQMLPHHVLPINPRPRRHVKRPPGRRAQGAAIARLYLSKSSLLPSSSPNTPAFMDESLDWVTGLVDECLKASKRQKLHQGTPLQGFVPPKTAPGAPVVQTSSRISSVPHAGAAVSSHIMSGTLDKSG